MITSWQEGTISPRAKVPPLSATTLRNLAKFRQQDTLYLICLCLTVKRYIITCSSCRYVTGRHLSIKHYRTINPPFVKESTLRIKFERSRPVCGITIGIPLFIRQRLCIELLIVRIRIESYYTVWGRSRQIRNWYLHKFVFSYFPPTSTTRAKLQNRTQFPPM